jgi:hypothetical protein
MRQLFGDVAVQNPREVQITRVDRNSKPVGFLVESPEPLDWTRIDLTLSRAVREALKPQIPGPIKITDVDLGTAATGLQSITLLLREAVNPTGCKIEMKALTNPAEWADYYTFTAESTLPAGTRVGVYAGSESGATPETPGIVRRLAGTLSALGTFPPGGLDVRIISPDGQAGHTRRFLPDTDYSVIAEDLVQIIRKGDSTGFFVLTDMPGGSGTAPFAVQHRLEMRFHRANRERVPSSQIFSQAGNSADEVVRLDIPWDLAELV